MFVLVTCKFDDDLIKNEGAIVSKFSPLYYITYWKNIRHSRASNFDVIIASGRKSNSSEILYLSWLPSSFTKIRLKRKALSSTFFSGAQGRVASKLINGFGWSSNSSEILCLSWLFASLMTI